MKAFDQLIDELDQMVGDDDAMDRLIVRVCIASAIACIAIMAWGR